MNNEDAFYKELADTPELPSDAYTGVCKKIARVSFIKRATLIMVITALFSVGFFKSSNTPTVSQKTIEPEIASELQIIQDYLNGTDASEDSESYAYLDME